MKKILITLGAALALTAQAAGSFPDKAVNIIVPFPAGGSTDTVARAMALSMGEQLGKPFVVENRPGATGTIGAGAVKRAPADGYTLLVASLGPFVVTPHLVKNVPYDAGKDFDYITIPVQAPNVLVASPAQKARTVAEVIAALKANPGKISFASSGNGSSDHLSAELFWQQSGTEGMHVPYKGGAPAITDLIGGQVDFSFQNVNAVLPHLRSGKLHAIAVTGSQRSPVLPDVPTLAEAGVKGAEVYSWQGLAAQGPARRCEGQAGQGRHRLRAAARHPQALRGAGPGDRGQHARGIHALPGPGIGALEATHPDQKNHR